MEANSKPNVMGLQSLPELLQASYKAKNNQQLQQSEKLLKELMMGREAQHLAFLSLVDILTKPYDEQLRDATCIQLKSLCYSMSNPLPPENTPFYLEQLYTLLTRNGLSRIQREYIGTAIEHFLNSDQRNLYKKAVLTKSFLDMTSNDISVLHGAMEAYLAYVNSLTQIEDQASTFIQSGHLLKGILIRLSDVWLNTKNNPQQSTLPLVYLIDRIINIIDIIVPRIIDQRQIVQEQVTQWQLDQDWPKIFHIYLLIGTNQNVRTMVCYHKHAIIFNKIKQMLLKFMFIAYPRVQQFLLVECYQTFMNGMIPKNTDKLSESQNNLMTEAFNILESQIKKPQRYTFFSYFSVSIIVKALEYIRPTALQLQKLKDDPSQFIKELCDSCEYFQEDSPFVKACSVIFTIVETVDGMANFVTSIINILIQYSVEQPTEQVSPLLEQFNKYEIFNAPKRDRIAIGLQLMCLLVVKQPTVIKMMQLLIQKVLDFDDAMVIVRCMMAIAKLRIFVYSPWLIQQMPRCQAFRLQGLESFSRMLRHEVKPPQATTKFIESLSKTLDFMDVNCPTYQRLLLDNYHNLVVTHQNKLGKTIQMLIQRIAYLNSIVLGPQEQQELIHLHNMLQAIIQKQQRASKLLEIQDRIVRVLKNDEMTQSIMSMILFKTGKLTQSQRRMAGMLLYRPFNKAITNVSLLYLNRIVNFEDNAENIYSLVQLLCQIVMEIDDQAVINQILLILGQVIVKCKKSNKMVEDMVRAKKISFDLTKLRMMELLLLSLIVGDPLSPDVYQEILKFPWWKLCLMSNLPLDRKICVAGICNVVEIQCKNGQFPLNLIFQLGAFLKKHCDEKKIQIKKSKKSKIRGLEQTTKQQTMQQDDEHKIEFKDGGILDQKTHHLMQYQHPILNVNQLAHFQEMVKKYRDHLQKVCNQEQIELLRDLLGTMEDKKGRTRKILKIKQ